MFVTCFAVRVTETTVVDISAGEVENSRIRPRTRSRGNNHQDGTQSIFRLGHFSSAGGSPDHLRRKTAPNARARHHRHLGGRSLFCSWAHLCSDLSLVCDIICILCVCGSRVMNFTSQYRPPITSPEETPCSRLTAENVCAWCALNSELGRLSELVRFYFLWSHMYS